MQKGINCLWQDILKGDETAFDILFKKLYPSMLNFASKFINYSDAEEIVEDVFINLWKNRHKITITGSVKLYIYQSVHNHAINRLKLFNTNKYLPNNLVNEEKWKQIHNTYFVEDKFIEHFEALETENMLLKALELLPEKRREVFLLSRYEGMSHKEIANRLGISQNTVRVHIFRTLEYLSEYLSKKLF